MLDRCRTRKSSPFVAGAIMPLGSRIAIAFESCRSLARLNSIRTIRGRAERRRGQSPTAVRRRGRRSNTSRLPRWCGAVNANGASANGATASLTLRRKYGRKSKREKALLSAPPASEWSGPGSTR
jgi:hypothetical protein